MLNLFDIIQEFKREGIKVYEVELPPEIISNGIGFFDIDDFLEYLSDHNITTVFGSEYFASIEDYLITEEIIEKECDFFNYNECLTLQKQIEEYNNTIKSFDFKTPVSILLACIVEGVYMFVYLSEEKPLEDAKDKLRELVVINEEEIKQINVLQNKELESLKKELKKYILTDDEFVLCTNQRLRLNYTINLLHEKLDEYYEPLKRAWIVKVSPGVHWEATNFVELIWKEMKVK